MEDTFMCTREEDYTGKCVHIRYLPYIWSFHFKYALWSLKRKNIYPTLFCFFFLRLHPRRMEVPRPGNEFKPALRPTLQLRQLRSFNPMHRAGNWTHTSSVNWAAAVRFLTPVPQWELLPYFFHCFQSRMIMITA